MRETQHSYKLGYRAWQGYRLIFTGRMLPLDRHFTPVFKSRELSDPQKRAIHFNLGRIFKSLGENYYWLFAFANGVQQLGDLPYPFSLDLTDSQIKNMHRIYRQYIEEDFEKGFNELQNTGDFVLQPISTSSIPPIIEMIMEGEVSIVSAMLYHSRVEKIDTSWLEGKQGLLQSRIKRVLDTCFTLQDTYNLAGGIVNVQKEMLVEV